MCKIHVVYMLHHYLFTNKYLIFKKNNNNKIENLKNETQVDYVILTQGASELATYWEKWIELNITLWTLRVTNL